MGTFRIGLTVENHVDRSQSISVGEALVDTGSEFTWVAATELERIHVQREKMDLRFVMANGEIITRTVGFAIIRVGDRFTIDEIVFGEPGDQTILGARTLEGLNLTVDATGKKLVAAGPLPAA